MKSLVRIVLLLGLTAVVVIVAVNLQVASYSDGRIYNDVESVPASNRVAIVLGARVKEGGIASNTLHDRVLVGTELYKAGKTSKLLLSGGNDEPEVMKKLAIDLGVPENDLLLDDKGIRTYESCLRAKQQFTIDSAIIVTQDYHLPRSIYLCRTLGIDAIAINAKRRDYDGENYFWLREYFSRILAWYDINF